MKDKNALLPEYQSGVRCSRKGATGEDSLEQLLDPDNPSVMLLTLERAARVLGKNIRIDLAV